MFLPSFIFEEEDLPSLRSEGILLSELYDKVRGVKYYKLNVRRLNDLIELIYNNGMFSDWDKADVEFNLRTTANIFTSIVNNSDVLSLTQAILAYYKINPYNAKVLMTYIRYPENKKDL